MAIERWDPFAEFMSLRQAIDRLFEEAWVRPWGLRRAEEISVMPLPLDIYETADELVVVASLPGVRPEDVDVSIKGDVLRIQGEIKRDAEVRDEQYYCRERRVGRFSREITLPVSVKADEVRAQFEAGVLRLRMPKAEEARARRIPIQTVSAPQVAERAA